MSDNKYLELIGKLLRQAEGTNSEAEAELAMKKAQSLATANGIDLARARAHVGQHEKREVPTVKNITIGDPGKRGLATYVRLFLEIAKANDVECNIAHNSTYVVAFGFKSDIEVCEALYASLIIQMVRASDAYIRSGEYKTEMTTRQVTRTDSWGRKYKEWDFAPVPAQTARRSFQQAFAYKVGSRLAEARREATQEAVAAERERENVDAATSTGTELVLVAKAVEVADFYKQKSTARGSWKGERGKASSSNAYDAGHEAGARARLGGEKALGGSQKALR